MTSERQELTAPARDLNALHGDMAGVFRLRLGDYRVLFILEDDAMFIFGVLAKRRIPSNRRMAVGWSNARTSALASSSHSIW